MDDDRGHRVILASALRMLPTIRGDRPHHGSTRGRCSPATARLQQRRQPNGSTAGRNRRCGTPLSLRLQINIEPPDHPGERVDLVFAFRKAVALRRIEDDIGTLPFAFSASVTCCAWPRGTRMSFSPCIADRGASINASRRAVISRSRRRPPHSPVGRAPICTGRDPARARRSDGPSHDGAWISVRP